MLSCQRYPLRGFADVLFWCVLAVLVCLTTCGLLRILVDVLCWCVLPSNVRSRSGQPCSPLLGHPLRGLLPSVVGGYCAGRPICASFAPLGVYIYAFGGESCTTRHPLLRSARQDPDRDRAWHPRVLGPVGGRSSLTSGKSAAPPARCIHHPRHDASSAGYRLLASFAPGVASREPSPCRSPAFAPSVRRLGPDLPYGAFFFVALALADVPSASLIHDKCAATPSDAI